MPATDMEPTVTHHGGCHCGRVRFEVDAPAALDALDCNCSICAKTGFLHLIVPQSRFRLRQGRESLVEYVWGTGAARHLFCGTCGVKSFYVPRSNPDGIDVNVRCLDEGTIASLRITPFEGRGDWDAQAAAIGHLSQ
jgi:hypothetical protein